MTENREEKTNRELGDVRLRVMEFDRARTQDELDTMREKETALLAQLALLDAKIEKHRDTDIMMKALTPKMGTAMGHTPFDPTQGVERATLDAYVASKKPVLLAGVVPGPSKVEAMAEELYPSSGECDPNGTEPHTAGAKLDAGKPLAGLVLGNFSRALQGVVDVGTYGARKYSPSGWTKVPGGVNRYKDALYRHLLELEKTPLDSDSGLSHLAQVCWNALAWSELVLRRQEIEADEAREGINEDAGC